MYINRKKKGISEFKDVILLTINNPTFFEVIYLILITSHLEIIIIVSLFSCSSSYSSAVINSSRTLPLFFVFSLFFFLFVVFFFFCCSCCCCLLFRVGMVCVGLIEIQQQLSTALRYLHGVQASTTYHLLIKDCIFSLWCV